MDRRLQVTDGGKKANQRALAHITVQPTAYLPKDFDMERRIVPEEQAQHIITAALYILATHKHHSDPAAIPAIPASTQSPKAPVTSFHIDRVLRRRATPHLHPSRFEIAIASRNTLDTPPQHPALHILKADAQWSVLHRTHRVLMAGQAYTSEVGLEDPPRCQRRLLHNGHRPRRRPVGSPLHGTLLG